MNPPRALFVDYPLGHTAGRPGQPDEQLKIVGEALRLLHTERGSGAIRQIALTWPEPWNSGARDRDDSRTIRLDAPQYERAADRLAHE